MIDIDASTPYTDSIRKNCDGSIHYLNPKAAINLGPVDSFAHIPTKIGPLSQHHLLPQMYAQQPDARHRSRGLHSGNSNGLAPSGITAMQLVAARRLQQPKLFFFGPGAGWEISQAQAILPDALIRTNSLTPISPKWSLQGNFTEVRQRLWKAVKMRGTPEDKIRFSWMRDAMSMSPDFALKLDLVLGTGMFAPQSNPIQQDIGTIGELAEQAESLEAQDVLYERSGPIVKTLEDTGRSNANIKIVRHILSRLMTAETIVIIGATTSFMRKKIHGILGSHTRICGPTYIVAVHPKGPYADSFRLNA